MENQYLDAGLAQPLSVQDQELFARVWRRVMPEAENSPIGLGPAKAAPEKRTPPRPEQVPPAAPAPEAPEAPQANLYDVPCLGAGSLHHAPALREMMQAAAGLRQAYLALARRSQGRSARQLSELAAEQAQFVRQLGAAYFLITGERFRPAPQAAVPAGPLNTALREMFAREQLGLMAYEKAAEKTADHCLKGLFQELGAEAEGHMAAIRRVLEQL